MSTLQESTLESNRYELEALLSDRFVLTWRQLTVVGLVCVLFVLISFTPLSSHTTWNLATRGEAILANGNLPTTDVTQVLSQGMPVRETSWLSATFWALIARNSLEAVSWTTTILATISLVAVTAFLWTATRNSLLTGLGTLWFTAATWSLLGQGSALMLVLPVWIGLILLVRRQENDSLWNVFATVGLVAVWANLDSSVFIALALLALVWVASSFDLLTANGWNWNALIRDRRFQSKAITVELSVLVTLVTPLGVSLWAELFDRFSLSGSQLIFASVSGLCWLVAMLAFGLVLRKHAGSLPSTEIVLVAFFGLTCVGYSTGILWFAPLAALLLIPRIQQALNLSADPVAPMDAEEGEAEAKPPVLRFAYSLAAVLLCWIAFAVSPLSHSVLGGQPRTIGQLFDEKTPVAAVRYLRENPVDGLVYSPATWGDLLQSRQGGQAEVFATTSMAHLPQQVKYDYGRLNRGDAGWEGTADRYDIDAFVIDKHNQPSLLEAVGTGNESWQIAYEDDISLVLRRRKA